MKKFIPFKKEIPFKSPIAEITSISLEHTIHKSNDYEISGDFIVSGEYKVTETSITTQTFKYVLPFEVSMSDIYDIDEVIIDIDDFYYEIKNMENLEVNITLLLDNIKEKPLIEDIIINEDKNLDRVSDIEDLTNDIVNEELVDEECYEPEEPVDSGDLTREEINDDKTIIDNVPVIDNVPIINENVKNIFSFNDDDNESTYTVYIVRENDTIETILEKYNITIEKIKEYNKITEIKKGDKIIIPNV